jgi:hypothetical protein
MTLRNARAVQVKLCNRSHEPTSVLLVLPKAPFHISHQHIRIDARSFVLLPILFEPTGPMVAETRVMASSNNEQCSIVVVGECEHPRPRHSNPDAERTSATPPGAPYSPYLFGAGISSHLR